MKILFLFVLISSAVAQSLDFSSIRDEVVTNAVECATENKVGIRDVMLLFKNMVFSTEDHNNGSKCFIFCIMNRFTVMDDDGEFMVNFMKIGASMIPNEPVKMFVLDNLDPIVEESSASPDPCERAFQFVNIMYKKILQSPSMQQLMDMMRGVASNLVGRLMIRLTGRR